MGFFVPILDQSTKLICICCGQTFRSGVSRFEGGRRVGYLCHTCRETSPCSVILPGQSRDRLAVALRVNAWPVFAICLTAIGTIAVSLTLFAIVWTSLRAILLFSTRAVG